MKNFARCYGCFEEQAGPGRCPHCGWGAGGQPGAALEPGTGLHGRYIAGRVLGKPGGFGITYLGWHVDLETRVAIKEFFPRELVRRESGRATVVTVSEEAAEVYVHFLERVIREGRTLAQIRHPNVVRVTDYFEANGTAYLVMDYCEGRTLTEEVSRRRFAPAAAVRLMREVLDGLEQVHERGFIHRDITPNNILLAPDGTPILIDFGTARPADRAGRSSLYLVRTPGFAPFEQHSTSGEQGTWTDVYACGAVLYYLVSGEVPPDSPDRVERDPLVPLASRVRGVPPHVSDAVSRALAVWVKDRTRTVAQLRAQLGTDPPEQKQPRRAAAPARPSPAPAPRPFPAPPPLASPASPHRPSPALPSRPAPAPRRPKWLIPVLGLIVLLGATGWLSRDILGYRLALSAGRTAAEAGDYEGAVAHFLRARGLASGDTTLVVRSLRQAEGQWLAQQSGETRRLSRSDDHVCGIADDGGVFCWGANGDSQLGAGRTAICEDTLRGSYVFTSACSRRPIRAGVAVPFRSVATMQGGTCALTTSLFVYCWGNNELGQLGDGTTNGTPFPVLVSGGLTFFAISSGIDHTCGLAESGIIHCWGRNDSGQLGTPPETDQRCGELACRTAPTQVATPVRFRSVTAAFNYTCGISSQGEAYCWGDAPGLGSAAAVPAPVAAGHRFIALAGAPFHVCGIATSLRAFCWGSMGNPYGELGNGERSDSSVAGVAAVWGDIAFRALSAGLGQTCGIAVGGEAYCWGRLQWDVAPGRDCSRTLPACSTVPRRVAESLSFSALAAQENGVCGITADGSTYCWGQNDKGQLGSGSTRPSYVPVQVRGFKGKV